MFGHKTRIALGGTVIAAGALGLSSLAAGAAPSSRFTQEQLQLEQQLAGRVTQLQHLVSDVAGAASLTTADRATLNSSLSTEQANINALVVKVPTDKTFAQLRADRASMLKDNRVYAVMTPQVFITIGADTASATATGLVGQEAALQAQVASIAGLPGYQNALRHFDNYVDRLAHVTTTMAATVTRVLAQTPQGYPGNTHVFVNANHAVLNSNISIAYADYDATVIGLASGGYTGS